MAFFYATTGTTHGTHALLKSASTLIIKTTHYRNIWVGKGVFWEVKNPIAFKNPEAGAGFYKASPGRSRVFRDFYSCWSPGFAKNPIIDVIVR